MDGSKCVPGRMLFVLVCSLCSLHAATGALAQESLPNIVVILADDKGWNDVGYHGSEIRTPHIDQLAADGIELDRFYVQSTCSPTRAALLTGRSPQSLGIYSPLSKLNTSGLPLSAKLMSEYLRDRGYQTSLVGKWHLGFHEPAYRPTARGFDHFYGHLTGGIGYWDHVHGGGMDWQRNGVTLRQEGYSTHLMAAEIDRVIEERDPDEPLFLYAAFNAPHLPNEAPEESIAQYSHIANPNRRVHAAMISELDAAIGQLMATLEVQGMLENTLIWFMSDNGGLNTTSWPAELVDWFGRFENWLGKPLPFTFMEFIRTNALDGGSDNKPFRKGKQTIYEGGVRVPSIIYWRGNLSPGYNTQMITVQDVLPTLLAATNMIGIKKLVEPALAFDGVNQWLNVTSGVSVQVPDYLVGGSDGEALFRFPWKLLALNSDEVELYRLDEDPTESVDLSAANPDKVAQLQKAIAEYSRRKSIHVPFYKAIMDIDFFGGEEDRPPWSEVRTDDI